MLTLRSGQDKLNRTLLSRVASLLHLSHHSTGYSGRLSRRLLGYNRMITAAQDSLRDLLEACFATLLLNGDTDRESPSTDLTAMGQALPFGQPLNAALGIAAHHYLEQVDNVPKDFEDSNDEEARTRHWKHHLKTEREPGFLLNATDVEGDLEKAWSLWDAVLSGVKTANELGLVKDKMVEEWDVVNAWLASRR